MLVPWSGLAAQRGGVQVCASDGTCAVADLVPFVYDQIGGSDELGLGGSIVFKQRPGLRVGICCSLNLAASADFVARVYFGTPNAAALSLDQYYELRDGDWFAGATISLALRDSLTPTKPPIPLSFEGKLTSFSDNLPIQCWWGDECSLWPFVLHGTATPPPSLAGGPYFLTATIKTRTGTTINTTHTTPLDITREVNVLVIERPIVTLARVGPATARFTVKARFLARLTKKAPLRYDIVAERKGEHGWGNPSITCPPKGTKAPCSINGYDSRYYFRLHGAAEEARTTLNVDVHFPTSGVWRVALVPIHNPFYTPDSNRIWRFEAH